MKAIYNTLINILNRADFYYPMCDLGYTYARIEFLSERRIYFKTVEESDLTDDEKEDFRNLWRAKQDACNASMSSRKADETEADARYKAIFDKYFE